MDWQAIEDAPNDETTLIFADFSTRCMTTGAPHVWVGSIGGICGDQETFVCECYPQDLMATHFIVMPPFKMVFDNSGIDRCCKSESALRSA